MSKTFFSVETANPLTFQCLTMLLLLLTLLLLSLLPPQQSHMRQRMMKDHVLVTGNGCSLQRSACGVDTSSVSCYGIFAWWEDIFNASWERGSLEDLILCCRLDPTSFILSLLVDQVLNKTGMYYFMAHSMHGLSL